MSIKKREPELYIKCRSCELEQLYFKGDHNITQCPRCGSYIQEFTLFSGDRDVAI